MTLLATESIVTDDLDAEPQPRRWSKEEFYQMGEMGWFNGQRTELVDGKVIVLSPQNVPHSLTVDLVGDLFREMFNKGYWIRVQLPLDTGRSSLPEPDIAVVQGSRKDYPKTHPTGALLVVEVSDSSLSYDRSKKADDYAAAGVPDYWIINLIQRQIEIFRDPQPDPSQPGRWRYQNLTTLTPTDSVSPLQLPAVSIPVAGLLPPR